MKSNDELYSLISQAVIITDSIYNRLKVEVNLIINHNIKEQVKIENVLEQLLDICDRDDATVLYKKLCKYYYYINPEMTARYIYLFGITNIIIISRRFFNGKTTKNRNEC